MSSNGLVESLCAFHANGRYRGVLEASTTSEVDLFTQMVVLCERIESHGGEVVATRGRKVFFSCMESIDGAEHLSRQDFAKSISEAPEGLFHGLDSSIRLEETDALTGSEDLNEDVLEGYQVDPDDWAVFESILKGEKHDRSESTDWLEEVGLLEHRGGRLRVTELGKECYTAEKEEIVEESKAKCGHPHH